LSSYGRKKDILSGHKSASTHKQEVHEAPNLEVRPAKTGVSHFDPLKSEEKA
jgi:hypothetical protein